jgi:hypothetical protein
MIQKIDRIALTVVAGAVGLNAIVPGWQIMTDGSVYGFKLPTTWLTGYWPFNDYTVAGLLLLVVVGGGCLATAVVNAVSRRAGAVAGLVMGCVLVGWIAGELVFMNQTMVMTWVILASGVVLIALAAPSAGPVLLRGVRIRIAHRAN